MQRKTFTLWTLLGLTIMAFPWYWAFATSYLTADPVSTPNGILKCPDLVQHFLKARAEAKIGPPLFYVYPPLTAKFFAPLANEPYWIWHKAWTGLNVCLWAGFYFMWRRYFSTRFSLHEILVFLLFPGAIDCLRLGQNSFISVFLLLLAGLALKEKRNFIAGLLIGTLFYKPQLVLPITAILMMLKAYRAVLGSTFASLVWIAVGILACGWQSYGEWILFLQSDSQATFANLASTSVYSFFREAVAHGWPAQIKIIWVGLMAIFLAATWFWISRSAFLKQLPLWEQFFLLIPWATVTPLYYGLYDWLLCVPALMLLARYVTGTGSTPIPKIALAVVLFPNLIYSLGLGVIATKLPFLFLPVLLWFVLVICLTRILTPPRPLPAVA